MNQGLQYLMELETVTFNGDSLVPEISGYGNTIPVKIFMTDEDKPGLCTVIKIGDNLFLPSQLQEILDEHCNFVRAVNCFHGKN